MQRNTTIQKHLETAERLAAENGGKLPVSTVILASGHAGLLACIHKNREVFEHLLPRDAHGRDKEKLAIVEANLDMDESELAKLASVSLTTLRRWKQLIREDKAVTTIDRTPEPATIDAIAAFAEAHMPDDWRIAVEISKEGCFVNLIAPNGIQPYVEDAEGKATTESIIVNLDYARKRAGLDPVEWRGNAE